MCVSVRGILAKNDSQLKRELGGCVRDHDGNLCRTALQIREVFFDELAKGHEVVPCGTCDNFDFKTGCKGHEEKAEEAVKP
jgi:hypothetical protein